MTDGLDTTGGLTLEIAALFGALATPATDDMQLFIVPDFYNPGFQHFGRAYPDFSASGLSYVNSVLVNASLLQGNEARHTIAHEIGHVLTNAGHYGGETGTLSEAQKRNLMTRGGSRNTNAAIDGGRRLDTTQENSIHQHRLSKNP